MRNGRSFRKPRSDQEPAWVSGASNQSLELRSIVIDSCKTLCDRSLKRCESLLRLDWLRLYPEHMAYDAFTIDTNMAIQGGLNLESGLLGQLTQFKDGQIELVLSDIVVREIRKHLVLQVKKVRETLVNAAARAEQIHLTEGDAAADLRARAEGLGEPRDIAGKRLKMYLEATGATAIPVKLASMDELVKSYFSATPPFDAAGAKKSEFPDAIALLSLEAWARKAGKRILAVSQDGGWAEYAATSEHIDVEADFAKALQIVQEHADDAQARIADILAAVDGGALPRLAAEVESGLRDAMPHWPIHGEGGGSFYLELDSAELKYGSHTFTKDDDGYDITIVRMGSSQIVARIGAQFSATARADFSLSVWDSIDKEHVGMGSESSEQEVEFEGAFLLTLSGDFAEPLDEALDVEEIEIVDAPDYFDFGEIEFQPDPSDYEDWLAEERDADVTPDLAQETAALEDGQPF